MEKLIETIDCVGEDGEEYTVLVYQTMIDASSFDGPATIKGLKRLVLDDGAHVNFVNENTFRTLDGLLLKRR